MIANNSITHPPLSNPLNSWRLDTLSQGLVVGVLSTILSYTVSSLVHDLLLGIKPGHCTSAPIIQLLLLSDDPTPLSISAATLRKDQLDRARFKIDVPETASIARAQRRIPPFVLFALTTFVCIAPLTNLIALLLTIETDRKLSFSQVGFSPVAIGVIVDGNYANLTDLAIGGVQALTAFPRLAEQPAEFFFIRKGPQYIRLDSAAPASFISLQVSSRGEVQVLLFAAAQTFMISLTASGDLFTDDKVYRLKGDITERSARLLLTKMASVYDTSCRHETITYTDQDIITWKVDRRLFAEVPVKCVNILPEGNDTTLRPPSHILSVLFLFIEMISFVPATTFEAFPVSDLSRNPNGTPVWKDALDLPIFTMPKSYLSLGALFFVVGCVVALRIVIKAFTRNDAYDA